jgi:hypothetical protein
MPMATFRVVRSAAGPPLDATALHILNRVVDILEPREADTVKRVAPTLADRQGLAGFGWPPFYSPDGVRASLFALAAVALGAAINVADGNIAPEGIAYLTVAVAAALGALLFANPSTPMPRSGSDSHSGAYGWFSLAVISCLLYQAYLDVTSRGAYEHSVPADWTAALRGLATVAAICAAMAHKWPAVRSSLVIALVLLHATLAVRTLHATPDPHIDGFYIQRESAEALVHGTNPYAITFQNIYGDDSPFYAPGLSINGRLQFGFVYPPLSLLLALPGYFFGDVRYSQLVAVEAAAAFMAFARPGPFGPLAAALFLLTPRSLFVLKLAWIEPFVVMLLAACVFAAFRARSLLPYLLGLFLCVKQYAVFAIVPSLLLAPRGWPAFRSFALKAIVTAFAVTLPLAMWNFHAFWKSVIVLQLLQPFRADALSYLVWFSRNRPTPLPTWIGFGAAALVTAAAYRQLSRSPEGFAASVAVVFLTFFAFNKQAFANYYFFVIGAFCCALAANETRGLAEAAQGGL